MGNLTFAHSLIKQHTIDPLEGHTVVVFETVGSAGEEFRFQLEPGDRVPDRTFFEKLGLRRGPNYFAYAVNRNPSLRTSYTESVNLADNIHDFKLLIEVDYRIDEPRLFVIRRFEDPLQKLRDEITSILKREIALFPWERITDDFQDVTRRVRAGVLDSLIRPFAQGYGLEVTGIWLDARISETQYPEIIMAKISAAGVVEKHKSNVSTEVRITEAHNEYRVTEAEKEAEAYRRISGMADKMVEAFNVAIGQIGVKIDSPASLHDAVRQIEAMIANIRQLASGAAALPAAGRRIEIAAGGQNGAGAVINEMLKETATAPDSKVQRQLQSSFLHIVGELLLDDEADKNLVQRYKNNLHETIVNANLPSEQFEYFKKVIGSDYVRNQLL